MSEVETSVIAEKCDQQPRAEQCTVHATTDCRICRAEPTRRTDESVRAEKAFRDWSKEPESERPLARHRFAHIRVLREWMDAHGVSKCRLADMLGVNEKQVRKMLKGEATIPGEVSSCIPKSLRQDYLDRLAELDGGAPSGLQARIDRLTMSEALDLSRRITERIARLASGAR